MVAAPSSDQALATTASGQRTIAETRRFEKKLRDEFSLEAGSTLTIQLEQLDSASTAAERALAGLGHDDFSATKARDLLEITDAYAKALDGVTASKVNLNLAETSKNASWLFVTCMLVFLGSLAKNLFVFRPLYAQTKSRQLELEHNKAAIEKTIQDLVQKGSELQSKQAVLEDQLADNQVISENLSIATSRLQKVLSSLPIACIGIDINGRVYEWNQAAQSAFGYSQFDLFESPLADAILDPEDRPVFADRIQEAAEQDQPITFEMPAVGRDGQRAMIEWNMMPMRGMGGEVSSLQLTANDITERVLQADKLKDLAFKDALTGLCNRRSFLDTLQKLYPHTSTENPMSIVLMDVDKFKNYNDTYGHPEGDALLRRIGELMSELVPEPYLPARYGGEEFVVILPGASSEKAFELAELLRNAIEARTKDLHGATASFGIGTSTDPELSPSDVIERADKSLYYSKHRGRNRTSIWTETLGNSQAA